MSDTLKMTDIRDKAIQAVENKGQSQASVAAEYGVSPSAVSRWLKDYRLAESSAADSSGKGGAPRGEIGAVGRSHSALFDALGNDEYLAALRWPQDLTVYEKMRRSDSQVQAMLLVLELPIRSTKWVVEPYDAKSSRDVEIAEFVEENLFAGPPKGMTQHWDDFLRLALTMFPFGHSVFEKVFEVKNGFVHWRKFAQRPQRTIYDFLYDDNGGPAGVKHLKVTRNSYEYVEIPIDKLLMFSHRMESGDLRGQSVLRAAYKHWKIKDFCYKILNIGIERNLVGTPVIKPKKKINEDSDTKAREVVEDIRAAEKAGIVLPEGWELDLFEGKRNPIDIMPYITHHDLMIVRGILAQFINLGSGDVGSFALSKDQSELFLMCLEASARYICNTINSYAIPQLVDYNWSVEGYPTLNYEPLGGQSDELLKTLTDLADGKLIVPDENIEEWLRERLDLPEKGEPLAVPTATTLQYHKEHQHPGPCVCGAETLEDRIQGRTFAEDGKRVWRRDLTAYEKTLNLIEIESFWDSEEAKFLASGKEIGQKQINDLFERVKKALDAGDYDAISKIPVRYRGEFTTFLTGQQLSLINFGKTQAAAELGLDVAKVPTPADVKKIAGARAGVVADQLAQRIKAAITLTALAQLESGATVKAAMHAARGEAERVLEQQLIAAASIQIGNAINHGRDIAAGKANVRLAQYSAILDDKTCPLCSYLDGKIIELSNPDYDRFTPQLHQSCRCLWVYIRADETPQPSVTWQTPPAGMVQQYGSMVG